MGNEYVLAKENEVYLKGLKHATTEEYTMTKNGKSVTALRAIEVPLTPEFVTGFNKRNMRGEWKGLKPCVVITTTGGQKHVIPVVNK